MATVTTNIARQYSDLDLNFTVHPVRKDINRNLGDMAVINSVKNLILTNHYEKPFHPEIGSNIQRLLFENMDDITASNIEREIEQTLNNFEPRVRVSKIQVSPDFDNNTYNVGMEFYIINRTEPITINFFLQRVR
jgi:phage baseplate assembly protein W